jgi:hypothetical protein
MIRRIEGTIPSILGSYGCKLGNPVGTQRQYWDGRID